MTAATVLVEDASMDDETYAHRLFEILTRPLDPDEPVDHYGMGEDWIDRYDGFGTDLRVTRIDVVPGEHGSQMDIGFVLEVPEGVDVPAEGSLLLPLDEEWREVSGFSEPEDYAPRVATHLMRNARNHISAHDQGPRDAPDVPPRDAQHAMLLKVLGREGEVAEQGPGRYVVRRPGAVADLVVVLAADEWEQALSRHGTPQDGAFDFYEELLASRGRDERFVVFWEGELVTSTREELPPAASPPPAMREVKRRIAEARASGKDFGWFAYEPGSPKDQLPGMESNHRR